MHRYFGIVAAERIAAGQIVTLTGEYDDQGREKVRLARWEKRDTISGMAIRDIAEGEVVPYEQESGRLG